MEDPQDRQAIQDVRRITGMDIVPNIATISEINQAIEVWYSNTDIDKAISEYAKKEIQNTLKDEITGEEDVNSAPIVRLVHNILESCS